MRLNVRDDGKVSAKLQTASTGLAAPHSILAAAAVDDSAVASPDNSAAEARVGALLQATDDWLASVRQITGAESTPHAVPPADPTASTAVPDASPVRLALQPTPSGRAAVQLLVQDEEEEEEGKKEKEAQGAVNLAEAEDPDPTPSPDATAPEGATRLAFRTTESGVTSVKLFPVGDSSTEETATTPAADSALAVGESVTAPLVESAATPEEGGPSPTPGETATTPPADSAPAPEETVAAPLMDSPAAAEEAGPSPTAEITRPEAATRLAFRTTESGVTSLKLLPVGDASPEETSTAVPADSPAAQETETAPPASSPPATVEDGVRLAFRATDSGVTSMKLLPPSAAGPQPPAAEPMSSSGFAHAVQDTSGKASVRLRTGGSASATSMRAHPVSNSPSPPTSARRPSTSTGPQEEPVQQAPPNPAGVRLGLGVTDSERVAVNLSVAEGGGAGDRTAAGPVGEATEAEALKPPTANPNGAKGVASVHMPQRWAPLSQIESASLVIPSEMTYNAQEGYAKPTEVLMEEFDEALRCPVDTFLQLHKEDYGRRSMRVLSFAVPYWINNVSGHDLIFKDNQSVGRKPTWCRDYFTEILAPFEVGPLHVGQTCLHPPPPPPPPPTRPFLASSCSAGETGRTATVSKHLGAGDQEAGNGKAPGDDSQAPGL